MKYMKG